MGLHAVLAFFIWPHEAASGQPDLHARVRGASQLTAAAAMVAAAAAVAAAVSHAAAVMAAAVAASVLVEGYGERSVVDLYTGVIRLLYS